MGYVVCNARMTLTNFHWRLRFAKTNSLVVSFCQNEMSGARLVIPQARIVAAWLG